LLVHCFLTVTESAVVGLAVDDTARSFVVSFVDVRGLNWPFFLFNIYINEILFIYIFIMIDTCLSSY
jgi:hypothetical protein